MNSLKIESKVGFSQNKEYVISYLQSRGVKTASYYELIRNNDFGLLKNNVIKVSGIEYRVDAICSCSKNSGFDIVEINKNLETSQGDILVIAGVAGDDVICIKLSTGEIFLWLIETGEWEKVFVSSSIDSFINMIVYK